jgi:hypothetical protein
MKKYLLVVLLMTISISAMGRPLSTSKRAEVHKLTKDSCIKSQTEKPENANVPAGQISQYCSCVANRTVGNLTQEEAEYIDSTNDSSRYVAVSLEAYNWCGTH